MKEMWNNRYAKDEYVYGIHPNVFFKERLLNLHPGKILLPAEGEGRNAVFAAVNGWDVRAFDFSMSAKEKALRLSDKKGVGIQYKVHSIEEANYKEESFDVIALIFAHSTHRKGNHLHLLNFLKPGGTIILEAYSKKQLKNGTGGPKDASMLFSIDELKEDFYSLSDMDVWEEELELNEGTTHKGRSNVVRLIGVK